MSRTSGRSPDNAAAALDAAGLGTIVQILVGADYPTVPPGPLLVLAAVLVWIPRMGAASAFLLMGRAPAPTVDADPDAFLPLVALVVTLVATAAGALAERRRTIARPAHDGVGRSGNQSGE